ncbi:Reticulon-4-interacting protein 1, mitochondrial [Tolypocladium ophioglossoides CBS 100239]|uniref:Reticulon-4-interacting protein 1, mitochondrial n=1 Tax=Tolypocladium ophioglossoides (strain CBS 100239) TaxID=1163406 RepID=A0A0L0NAU7_TOLOC|nr:Reticulon-4-interacting protein 1, mitochondrial [Tolypocladium ophioglossoides CBS 100239]
MSVPNPPQTIKTVIQPDPQSPSLTLTLTPLPIGKPDDHDVHLIQVKATSPCFGELTWEVNFPDFFLTDRERVPCTECAGVVVKAPSATGTFKPGDEVYFRLDAWRRGCLSEYTLAGPAEMAHKPKSLSWAEAAATPLSSLTAYQGLFEHGLLDPDGISGSVKAREHNKNTRVLITAAGGSVGSWAVQLAAAAGAGAIIAVCGPSKADAVRQIGATDVVDYTKRPLAEWASEDASREVDMVLDCVGGDTLAGCWAAVKEGGVLLSVSDSPDRVKPKATTKRLVKSTWFLVEPRGRDLAEITKIVDGGRARPWVDSVVEFEHFDKAFQKVQGRRTKGKVVIKVAD